MGAVIDDLGYPVTPRKLKELAWFYEEKKGVTVCQQACLHVNAIMVTIPWRRLEAAVDRHRKIKKAKP